MQKLIPVRYYSLKLLILTLSLFLTACAGSLLFPVTGEEAAVDSVNVIRTEAQPPQYFAVVTGHFPDTCTQLDHVEQELAGTTILVTLTTTQMEGVDCSPVPTTFEETIQLDVTGLSAGSYAVEVNGTTTTFILDEDHD